MTDDVKEKEKTDKPKTWNEVVTVAVGQMELSAKMGMGWSFNAKGAGAIAKLMRTMASTIDNDLAELRDRKLRTARLEQQRRLWKRDVKEMHRDWAKLGKTRWQRFVNFMMGGPVK